MIAFDTCLLVRFVTDDNQAQADLAESLMRDNTVFIPRTVLLESEWVLRSRYQKPREAIAAFFNALLETENVVIEDTTLFRKAVIWYKMGADFADAMHLAACQDTVLHTFDRNFCKTARNAGITPKICILKTE